MAEPTAEVSVPKTASEITAEKNALTKEMAYLKKEFPRTLIKVPVEDRGDVLVSRRIGKPEDYFFGRYRPGPGVIGEPKWTDINDTDFVISKDGFFSTDTVFGLDSRAEKWGPEVIGNFLEQVNDQDHRALERGNITFPIPASFQREGGDKLWVINFQRLDITREDARRDDRAFLRTKLTALEKHLEAEGKRLEINE